MGWERRGKKWFYYRSKKVNGRTVKVYVGTGAVGEAAAREDMEATAARVRAREELLLLETEYAAILADMDYLAMLSALLLKAEMTAAGYHQHARGEWRKKRKPRAEAKPAGGTPGSA